MPPVQQGNTPPLQQGFRILTYTDVAGEGAGHHTRGRACSLESFADRVNVNAERRLATEAEKEYPLADMATVGEQLKAAREAQRLTVTQVADMTKIRSDHIRAIDQGNYDVFSAPVYIRGFVRTYAMALKLDTTVILAQLNQELAESGGQALPAFHPPASGVVDSAMFHLSTAGRRMLLPILAVRAGRGRR